MKKLIPLFLLIGAVWNIAAQETLQFITVVTETNDINHIVAKGTLLTTSNHLAYSFDTFYLGPVVHPKIVKPSMFATDVIVDFGEVLLCGFNINYCGFRGEFDLTEQQIAEMQSGRFSLRMDDSHQGEIQFVGAYNFRETNVIPFISFIEGENPTNRRPRYVRWGRAKFGLTGSQASYEITLPVSYGPYSAVIFNPTGGWQVERPVFNLGTLDCQSVDMSDEPPGAEGLEVLPRCVARGSFCIPDALIPDLLAGGWQLRVVLGTSGMNLWRSIDLLDSDSDGVPDYLDACPKTALGGIVNASGCSIAQLCPCGGPWRNHGEYVNCLKAVTSRFVSDGLITALQQRAILKHGSASDCGKPRR